jgi:methylase of polypeptide subunit release factors
MDRELFQHKQWLGLLQPTGLVVSPPALTKAGVCVNRDVIELQQDLQELAAPTETDGPPAITDFVEFATEILNWEPEDLTPQNELPPELTLPLPEYGETLKPTYGVPTPDGDNWIMLVQILPLGEEMDAVSSEVENSRRWQASPQARFERLLRETEIPVGLLCNGSHLRLVYAPRGESSGFVTFPVGAMCEVSGRLILGAMEMLLCEARVLSASEGESLADLLRDSRQYQNEVSVKLADQVLGALWELLRGFQAADIMVGGKVLGDLAAENPQHIYGGLITTLLRLVFLLYAEDEGLMPGDRVYSGNYSVTRLFEKLQQDAGNYPDTMDQRYGAWAWLVTLFRLVYEGGGHVPEYLPARHGELFDPETYPFLAGVGNPVSGEELRNLVSREELRNLVSREELRNLVSLRNQVSGVSNVPRVADGVIYRVLRGLLIVDGERLSYRSLDVEHIGSVYEAVMGYEVKRATGTSIGVWSKPAGAKVSVTVVVNIDSLLKTKTDKRNNLLDTEAGCKLSGNALKELKAAKTAEDVAVALGRRVSPQTPVLLPGGSLYLQPTEERRRSGSHYTPRSMTEPIVRDALAPVLARLGDSPTPEQILSLKICDLAMGSGAFLVESCRQLAEVLVKVNSQLPIPNSPEAEEPLLHARRIIAQRCLYGVDKNPFAVSLAKLSLWLVTLSKNQPFTFLDHALKCGDSLVGLTGDEIKSFTWYPQKKGENLGPIFEKLVDESLEAAREKRNKIMAKEDRDYDGKKLLSDGAKNALKKPTFLSDLIMASFFKEEKKKARREELDWLLNDADKWHNGGGMSPQMEEALEFAGDNEVKPFNWHLEFPEVFDRKNSGFDVVVGNPPFIGGSKISSNLGSGYLDWLKEVHPETHGNGDLVAHFFRRAFFFSSQKKEAIINLPKTRGISKAESAASLSDFFPS